MLPQRLRERDHRFDVAAAFTLSVDDVVIASFVSGPGSSTLPMVDYSKVKFGITPEINALATLIIAFVTTVVVIAAWVISLRPIR